MIGRLGGAGLWTGLVSSAHAHGERTPGGALAEGAQVLFSEPSCVLLLLGLVLFIAQAGPLRQTSSLHGAVAGWLLGGLLAGAALAVDLALALLVLALLLGGVVASGRVAPVAACRWLTAAAACGCVLMLAPAPGTVLAQRLPWLAGAMLCTALVFANLLGLLRVVLGPHPGDVTRMLTRVAGAWLATAALLTLALAFSLELRGA